MGNCFRSRVNGTSAASELPTASRSEPTGTTVNPNLKIYTFGQLKRATGNFRPASMIGKGGLGRVYKGWVDEKTLAPSKIGVGIPVAIRKSDPCQSLEQWQAQVEFLGKYSHPNIVKLLGYYRDDKRFLLVYEYMHKGSLESHLFRITNGAGQLSWETRIKIAMGAAHGLAFLHTRKKQVTCRFFQIANILLDREFNAKLSEFGKVKLKADVRVEGDLEHRSSNSARIITPIQSAYAAPEYALTGRYSDKNDVYSFGIVLLEMITGMRVYDHSRPFARRNLADWAKPYLHKNNTLKMVMDPKLEGRYPIKAAFETAALILKCLQDSMKDRPSMDDVFKTLERISAINMAP